MLQIYGKLLRFNRYPDIIQRKKDRTLNYQTDLRLEVIKVTRGGQQNNAGKL